MIAYPKPKILLLDDDTAFLDAAAVYFEKKFRPIAKIYKFSTSQSFLQYIDENCHHSDSYEEILHEFYAGLRTPTDIKQTLKDLTHLPAILIVDHQLRGETTNGIEICKELRTLSPKSFITLLTSEVDIANALKLHNDATIDLFIQKDSIDSMAALYKHLVRHIENEKVKNAIEPDNIFWFETIIEDEFYCSKRDEFLQGLDFQSYLTISNDGTIAVLTPNDTVNIYQFSYEGFTLHG